MNMKKKDWSLQERILLGRFQDTLAEGVYRRWQDIKTFLFDLGTYHNNILGYSYLCFLLQQCESVDLHRFAADVADGSLSYLLGSQEVGLYHYRKVLLLNPNYLMPPEVVAYYNDHIAVHLERTVQENVLHELLNRRPETLHDIASILAQYPFDTDHLLPQESFTQITSRADVKKLILQGHFIKTLCLSHFSLEDIEEVLSEIAVEHEQLIPYAYVCFLIMAHEAPALHVIAEKIVVTRSYNGIPLKGIYGAGYYHLTRALELDPTSVDVKAALLFYSTLPEPLLSDAEAHRLAQEVIQFDSSNEIAIQVLMKDKK